MSNPHRIKSSFVFSDSLKQRIIDRKRELKSNTKAADEFTALLKLNPPLSPATIKTWEAKLKKTNGLSDLRLNNGRTVFFVTK